MLALFLASCRPVNWPEAPAAPLPSSTPLPLPSETPLPLPSEPPAAQPAPVRRLTLAQLQNAAYHSPDWGNYQLEEGVFYRPAHNGESPQLYSSVLSDAVFGDLNGDGFQDAAVILTTYNGGNGNSRELAAVLDQDGSPASLAAIPVGFRIALESVRIADGIITLELRVHGPDDGMCCPSQPETRRYRLEQDRLEAIQ